MAKGFVPESFVVPDGIAAPGGVLRLLNMDHLAQDFDAYMSDIEGVAAAFDPALTPPWPHPGLSMRLALADLGYCEWEHHGRTSFSYGVFSADGARELGCIYVHPTRYPGHDAEMMVWARGDHVPEGYADTLFAFARDWLARDWPFERVAYPGRGHDWAGRRAVPFVPPDFVVPQEARFEDWTLALLTMDHTRLDYAAYMANIDHIAGTLGPDHMPWPTPDLTPRLALADLGWCEWMHDNRACFSYGIFAPDMSREIGCLYVSPSARADHDAEICFWFVEDFSRAGIEPRFLKFARSWIERDWPFARIGFPGREVSWEAWLAA